MGKQKGEVSLRLPGEGAAPAAATVAVKAGESGRLLNGKRPGQCSACVMPLLKAWEQLTSGIFPTVGVFAKSELLGRLLCLGKGFGGSLCVVCPIHAVTDRRSWGRKMVILQITAFERKYSQMPLSEKQRESGGNVSDINDSMRSFLKHGS